MSYRLRWSNGELVYAYSEVSWGIGDINPYEINTDSETIILETANVLYFDSFDIVLLTDLYIGAVSGYTYSATDETITDIPTLIKPTLISYSFEDGILSIPDKVVEYDNVTISHIVIYNLAGYLLYCYPLSRTFGAADITFDFENLNLSSGITIPIAVRHLINLFY